jgi:hypothetical protein
MAAVLRDEDWIVPLKVFWHPDATSLLGKEGNDGPG